MFKTSPSLLLSASKLFMKVILGADDLDVKIEEEVCDVLKSWLQIQTRAGNVVHPDKLLPHIRWNGVSIDYVTSKLLSVKMLLSNPASVTFLSKVTQLFLMSGVQFDGLNTLHRHSTEYSNCVMVTGLCDGYTRSNEVHEIDLEGTDNVKLVATIPTTINIGSVTVVSLCTVFLSQELVKN